MKILVINGSPRKNSYSKVVAKFAFEHARQKYDAEFLDLSKNDVEQFRGFEEKYGGKTKEIVNSIKTFDAFIICTPVYDAMFSSALKNLFEHLNYKEFDGKTAGFAITSMGKISYLQVHGQLNALMTYFNIVSNPKAVYASHEHFDEKMNLKDSEIKERIKAVVDSTAELKSPK